MSTYNKARYNLAQFNVTAGNQIWLEAKSEANFGFSFAGQTHVCRGNSVIWFVGEKLVLDRGQIAVGAGSADFDPDVTLNGYFWLQRDPAINFEPEINLSQNAYAEGACGEIMESEINLSQDVALIVSEAETFDADINLSQIVSLSSDIGEVFAATADVISLSESVCEFPGLTLRPGQTLIVDAGMYNILLDGENAVHLQKGDWLDNLDRNTQSITITATNASRLSATILYTERYL